MPKVNNNKAFTIASYYGFANCGSPTIQRTDIQKIKSSLDLTDHYKKLTFKEKCKLPFCPEQKSTLIRLYMDEYMKSMGQPAMLYHEGTFLKNSGKSRDRIFGLEILGTPKSIAEAILMKASYEILKESYKCPIHLEINSVGDKDSIVKFTRELTQFYKKNMDFIHPSCKQAMKDDVFKLFDCEHEKCRTLKEDAPKSIAYLSESSRSNFKEVLEFLETLNIPYEINDSLLGDKCMSTETIFTFNKDCEDEKNGQILASGSRYNTLAKKIGYRKDITAIGVKGFLPSTESNRDKTISIKKPRVYFIQLGYEAKLKSLRVIDILRHARIPTLQSLAKDKLVGQLSNAESSEAPFTIIMGQKEAMEDTVIVRDMRNNSQVTVDIQALPNYLKKLK